MCLQLGKSIENAREVHNWKVEKEALEVSRKEKEAVLKTVTEKYEELSNTIPNVCKFEQTVRKRVQERYYCARDTLLWRDPCTYRVFHSALCDSALVMQACGARTLCFIEGVVCWFPEIS